MKRIAIIFIIAFCLLSFIEVSCLAEEPSSSVPGYTWSNELSATAKIHFLIGFLSGMEECLNKLTPTILGLSDGGKAWDELVDLSNFIDEHGFVILKVIDDLYKDPANMYIILSPIIEIAVQKLKGKDIETLLQKAREEGLQIFKEKKGNE